METNYIPYLILASNIVFFLLGFLSGKITSHNIGVLPYTQQTKSSKNRPAILNTIDETKFVVDIKTDGMEKKYDSLGDVTKVEENISESVNKLKNLKR